MHVFARVRADTVACPSCSALSASVRERYQRRLADGPVGGLPVWIILQVRRFNCAQTDCARRTFVEQVPGLTVYQLTHLGGEAHPVIVLDEEPDPGDLPATQPGLAALVAATRPVGAGQARE